MQQKNALSWKITLALVMGTVTLLSVASFVAAGKNASRVVDINYYQNGLHYDSYQGSGAQWQMSATLTKDGVQVLVADAKGAPVAGGTMVCTLDRRHPLAPSFPLAESSPGSYGASKKILPAGDLHATLDFTKGASRTLRRMVIFQ